MKLPPYYPKAEWRPSPNHGYLTNGYPAPPDVPGANRSNLAPFTLRAMCGHSTHGPLNADPPDRFFNPYASDRGSVHYWWYGNGRVVQMVRNDNAAYGNGVLNRRDGLPGAIALVREWYRTGRNPNNDTVSHEFCGTGNSAPSFTPVTDEQWDGFYRWREWCASEGTVWDETNTVLHKDISATACPDGRFTVADLLRKVASEVTQEQLAALTARIVELERRTGATPPNEQRARNADLLLYADGLNTAIWKNIAAIDDLRSIVADLSPSSTVAVADALELAADKLRGIDRHVDGRQEP